MIIFVLVISCMTLSIIPLKLFSWKKEKKKEQGFKMG